MSMSASQFCFHCNLCDGISLDSLRVQELKSLVMSAGFGLSENVLIVAAEFGEIAARDERNIDLVVIVQ